MKTHKVLAIIPARKGSKRLPGKNTLPLNGKTLIEHTILAASDCNLIDDIVITTDDDKIEAISSNYNVICHRRADRLSDDESNLVDVVKDVCKHYDHGILVLLQPTSPFRSTKHILEALTLFQNKNANAVISMVRSKVPVEWIGHLDDEGCMDGLIEKQHQVQSQQLKESYHPNGAIYIIKRSVFLDQNTFYPKSNVYAYKMDHITSLDIDDQLDYELAKSLVL
jgi:CMP-N,N'-diacetyllegionaminic acid synthase